MRKTWNSLVMLAVMLTAAFVIDAKEVRADNALDAFSVSPLIVAAEDSRESCTQGESLVIAIAEDVQEVNGFGESSALIFADGYLGAMTETEEVDVYDYDALEEMIESSVSLASSSSDESERRAWLKETMEEALLTFTETLDVSGYGITVEDLLTVGVNLINADYRFCYVNSTYSYACSKNTGLVTKVYFTYTADEEEAIQMLAELEAAIDEVANGMDSSWSDMEKALYINDYLARTCEYDTSATGEDHTAYGALVEHCTVCEGYAKAFYVVGERVGLDCGVVVSMELGHEWSYVQVGDSYYYVDVTWNDSTPDRLGRVLHKYFLKSYTWFQSDDGGHNTDDWIYSGSDTNESGDTDNVTDTDDIDNSDGTDEGESDEDDSELSAEDFADTSYDDYFWNDISQGFEYIDGYWYTVNNRDIERYVCDGSSFTCEDTLLTISDLWYVWNSSSNYYSNGYSGIASYDGVLYYSTPTVVWAYDLDGDEASTDADATDASTDDASNADTDTEDASTGTSYWEAYTLSDEYAELGYIYGIRVLDGALDIRLSTKLAASGTVGNYTVLELGTDSKTEIASCVILVDDSALIYDGTTLLPEVTITDGTYTLVEGQDYAIVSLNNISPGEKILYVAGLGNYTGVLETGFTISKIPQTITTSVEGDSASENTDDSTSGDTDDSTSGDTDTTTSENSVTITYGDTVTITASTSGDGEICYSSDNTSVVTIDSSETSDSNTGETTTAITAVGAGTAVITVTAEETELYASAAETITITAEPIDMSQAAITLSAAGYTYTGSAQKPIVMVTMESATESGKTEVLEEGTDYTLSYSNHINAGTATVTATGCGNYTGSVKATYTISKASQTLTASAGSTSIANGKTTTITASSTGSGSLSYSSSNTSVATVSSDGTVTAKGVGTATITVTASATANYTRATKTIQITVKPAAPTISSAANVSTGVTITWKKVTGATGYYVYRATSASGTYTKIATIQSGSTVSYTNTASGTYKVTSGKTYYYKVYAYASTGTSSASAAKSIRYLTAGKVSSLTNTSGGITVKWSKVTGASGYYIYRKAGSGSYKKIATITSGSTVSYTNKTTGTYKVANGTTYTYYVIPYYKNSAGTITKGTYSATKITVRLTAVSISSVKNSSSKKLTVKWKKNSKATGYQIQYSTSKSFASGNKTVTVSKAATTSKVISSLTKGKTYYVRIRAYKTLSGTKYYSAWSAKKSVKISK